MFLLDTNVVSVMMSRKPDQNVITWLRRQPSDLLYTATVCQAEILAGVAILPAGRRQADLKRTAQAIFDEDFYGRLLPFEANAASAYAYLFADRRKAGCPVGTVDLMLSAIARVAGAIIVTRNVTDFVWAGLTVINPWSD